SCHVLRKNTHLSSGAPLPQIGLGTWMSKPKEVENAVEYAVRNGYRHLDLAMIYENQDEVGAALKKVIPSVVKREELFITSKCWNSAHQPAEVEKELDETLKQLGRLLVHWPVAFVALDLETSLVDTWKAMVALPESKVKAIGVSNFTIATWTQSSLRLIVNQIEAHPLLPQDELVAYCKEKNIHITAYSPSETTVRLRIYRPAITSLFPVIGVKKLTDEPVVEEVAKKLGATPAQVLVAWGVYRGYSVIPKSVQNERIMSNFKQVELSKEDYEKITALGAGKHTRFNIPFRYTPKWDIALFDEPEEAGATHKVKVV
ncbi:NADP-dependent oxidoreductase domain-containing protein, partial [Mycena sp. CBHHK59/15]